MSRDSIYALNTSDPGAQEVLYRVTVSPTSDKVPLDVAVVSGTLNATVTSINTINTIVNTVPIAGNVGVNNTVTVQGNVGVGNALNVAITNHTQYTEGATAASITGTAAMAETASNVVRPIQLDAILNMKTAVQNQLVILPHDYIATSYVAAGNGTGEIEQVIYKTGGSGGTNVAVLTMTYDSSNRLITVTKT